MLVYKSNLGGFLRDVDSNQIDNIIKDTYLARVGSKVSPSEIRSWKNSLEAMSRIVGMRGTKIPETAGVAIEYHIPATSKRVDFLLSGFDQNKKPTISIIELKQWETASKTTLDGLVETFLGGAVRKISHPSYQAWSYATLLENFNEHVYQKQITLRPCAYLHNYRKNTEDIKDKCYDTYIDLAPIFLEKDASLFRSYLESLFVEGDEGTTIEEIEASPIRPSKPLANSILSMLEGNSEFIMIDEQKIVYEEVINFVRNQTGDARRVFIIEGGPGTGKSVVAINLLAKLTGEEQNVRYVSKNSAPREVYSSKLRKGGKTGSAVKLLFSGSGSFVDSRPMEYDALVVDEAHRLNLMSGLYKNLGENQIKEIIHSAKTSIFFLDEDQRVTLFDYGSKEEIERCAKLLKADVHYGKLESQFRCSGSDGYLAWLDDVLGIRKTANYDLSGSSYDFRVYNDPNDLFQILFEKNKERNSARLVAGYCWDWKSKRDQNTMDIEIPEFQFAKQWNLASDGSLWMIQPESFEQIGCIHTCQGLELDYIGVIIGKDLIYRDGQIQSDFNARSKMDQSIKGSKKLMLENPDEGKITLDRIIKNTYRTLMTRGMKGCYVYCVDSDLSNYLKSRVGNC